MALFSKTSALFLAKSGHFFPIFKKGRGDFPLSTPTLPPPPPPPLVARLSLKNNIVFSCYYTFFYKQLWSGLSPQSCLYFQGFRDSKLLNVWLVFWPSNLCLQGMQEISEFKSDICDQWFKNFPTNAFETAEFWCIVDLTAILRLLQRKNSTFL